MQPLLILGAGLAGYTLARELRALDQQREIILLSADDAAFYSKPMLSAALGSNKSADDLASASAQQMADKLGIEVQPNTRVQSIDRTSKRLFTDQGEIGYGELVLAVGAQPIRPPMAGDAADRVLSINNLDDYRRFRGRLTDAVKTVAIIGPGLIGCEFANDLIGSGRKVTLIGPDPWPISTLLPEQAGHDLQQALEKAGARFVLGTVAEAADASETGYRLRLANGESVEADLIISAIGLRPDLSLAQACGLDCNRGIVTDAQLRSSDPAIYALGDCAEVDGRNLPFVMPIMHGAKALAKTLSGTPTAVNYPPMPVVIKTTLHPTVVLPPAPGQDGQWQEQAIDGGVRALFHDASSRLAGFALTGSASGEKQALLKQLD